jgi:2-methylcitrate dehydratase PrpD
MLQRTDRITAAIADRIVAARYDDFSDAAIIGAKIIILDALGVMLAASREPIGQVLSGFLKEEDAPAQCTVVGLGLKTSAFWAAFANGTTCRALEYDPISPGHHPCGANLPPCLALTEKASLSGRSFLEAFIIGVELQHRLYLAAAARAKRSSSMGGGRGVLGTIPAAAVAAKLMGLPSDVTLHALAIAAARTGGIDSTGTMCNPADSGNAASTGIVSAALAAKGFTGRQDVFEGLYSFKQFLGEEAPVESIIDNFGKPWGLEKPGIGLKRYSCQGHTHRAIEAILALYKERPWHARDIESLDVFSETLPTVAPYTYYTTQNDEPVSAVDARFSLRYIAALAALEGKVEIDSFADEKRLSPPVLEMMKKVTVRLLPQIGHKVSVAVRFLDGTTLQSEASSAQNLGENEARNKFLNCARRVITESAAHSVSEILTNLERQTELGPFFALIKGGPQI